MGYESNEHKATIGPSVFVKGEISGEEDILIEGSVEGSINLKKNSVTVAKTGKVKANVHGVVITVEGEIIGDISGTEKVVVLASGRVVGNISAPRISLAEGGRVKGMMDTESAVASDAHRLTTKIEEGFSADSGSKKSGLFGSTTPVHAGKNGSTVSAS